MIYYLTKDEIHGDLEVYTEPSEGYGFFTRAVHFRKGDTFEGGRATKKWIDSHTIFKSDNLEKIVEMAALEGL